MNRDFNFDGLNLSWTDHRGEVRDISFSELVLEFKRHSNRCNLIEYPTGEIARTFTDKITTFSEPVVNAVIDHIRHMGITFEFRTNEWHHCVRFSHTGEGKIDY